MPAAATRHLLCLLLLVSTWAAAERPRVEISLGPHRISVELADSPATRALGLMHRKSLPADGGMLFVFAEDARHCMWMRNTHIPLTVLFAAPDGTILNLADMAPLSDATHCATGPARYALEIVQGWPAAHGIAAGQRIDGLEGLAPGR